MIDRMRMILRTAGETSSARVRSISSQIKPMYVAFTSKKTAAANRPGAPCGRVD